jgi:hypothetical protein
MQQAVLPHFAFPPLCLAYFLRSRLRLTRAFGSSVNTHSTGVTTSHAVTRGSPSYCFRLKVQQPRNFFFTPSRIKTRSFLFSATVFSLFYSSSIPRRSVRQRRGLQRALEAAKSPRTFTIRCSSGFGRGESSASLNRAYDAT